MRKIQHYYGILEALQRTLPCKPHIAGGAVRDTILERPIRDIDVFTHEAAADTAAALLRSDFGYVSGKVLEADGGPLPRMEPVRPGSVRGIGQRTHVQETLVQTGRSLRVHELPAGPQAKRALNISAPPDRRRLLWIAANWST